MGNYGNYANGIMLATAIFYIVVVIGVVSIDHKLSGILRELRQAGRQAQLERWTVAKLEEKKAT